MTAGFPPVKDEVRQPVRITFKHTKAVCTVRTNRSPPQGVCEVFWDHLAVHPGISLGHHTGYLPKGTRLHHRLRTQ